MVDILILFNSFLFDRRFQIAYLCGTNFLKSNTMSISRLGVSLESESLEALDNYVKENNYPNRSQAVHQLIERHLVEKKWQCNHTIASAITLIFDYHRRELLNRVADIKLISLKGLLHGKLVMMRSDDIIR